MFSAGNERVPVPPTGSARGGCGRPAATRVTCKPTEANIGEGGHLMTGSTVGSRVVGEVRAETSSRCGPLTYRR
jgi:hypothetical protein